MKIVAYLRVSTDKQGHSGLGLEAQQTALEAFAKANKATIVSTYTEWESGRKPARPELSRALADARKHKATLCIAKLDRLSRNLAFIVNLMESKVDFIAVDNPHANRLTVQIMACIAEHEVEAIRQRTREALASAKARGVVLGNPANLTPEAGRKGNAANTAAAQQHNAKALPLATKLRKAGKTLQEIADSLTRAGILTRRGCAYSTVAVMRLLSGSSVTA